MNYAENYLKEIFIIFKIKILKKFENNCTIF